MKLSSNPDKLRQDLSISTVAAIDFETSSVDVRTCSLAGLGAYLPEIQRAYYINVGHMTQDGRFPRYREKHLADALRQFLLDPKKRIIAHNASYELRLLLRMGLEVRCRVSDSLIHVHRADENLREALGTHHYHIKNLGYGLKEQTVVWFDQQPPTLFEMTKYNTIQSPPYDVGKYCVQDCINSYNLVEAAHKTIRSVGTRNLINTTAQS